MTPPQSGTAFRALPLAETVPLTVGDREIRPNSNNINSNNTNSNNINSNNEVKRERYRKAQATWYHANTDQPTPRSGRSSDAALHGRKLTISVRVAHEKAPIST